MHAFLLGVEGIYNRAAAVLSVAGLWLLVPSGLAEFSNLTLTDFLAGRIAPEFQNLAKFE